MMLLGGRVFNVSFGRAAVAAGAAQAGAARLGAGGDVRLPAGPGGGAAGVQAPAPAAQPVRQPDGLELRRHEGADRNRAVRDPAACTLKAK